MDNFKIVLIILVMFLVCCYLKNNRIFKDEITIFEGLPEAEVPEVPEVQANLQQPSSCRDSSTSEATTRPSILNYRSQASTEEVPRQVETDASNERVLNVISRPGGGLCKQTAESYREANAPNSPTAYLKDINRQMAVKISEKMIERGELTPALKDLLIEYSQEGSVGE